MESGSLRKFDFRFEKEIFVFSFTASGGYVEVGRVLLERGADVNAPAVPSSKETGRTNHWLFDLGKENIFHCFLALTIAAEKGHEKFVELLLNHGAMIDVRNKKGATPLWLAANNGHLEVVQILISRRADPDTCDSRKVTCLMAAFRAGHQKVVKCLVRYVRQFPSDSDCQRLINTVTDKVRSKTSRSFFLFKFFFLFRKKK